MSKIVITSTVAVLMVGASASAFAQTSDADCQNIFQRADLNADGTLQAEEAQLFRDAMTQAQLQPQDASMITQVEFMRACQQNAFANIDPATIGSKQDAASAEQPITATTDTVDPATQPSEQVLAFPEAIMASALIGADIYSLNNEDIADIKDVILSAEDGKPTHVIVDAGDHDVAIEMSQLQLVTTDDGLKLLMDGTQADLASYPVINR